MVPLITAGAGEHRAGGHPLLMQMGFSLELLKLGPGGGGGLQWKIKI